MIVRARAPLRLGLAGGGTDVSPFCDVHGGAVLNATIGLYAYAVLTTTAGANSIDFHSLDTGYRFESSLNDDLAETKERLPLHVGVYERVVADFNGGKRLPVLIKTWSDVPPGSGLGSSSTMVVALLKAFTEYLQLPLGEYDVARLAFEIERVDLGMTGGRQDQYAATFGGFNYTEFEPAGHVIVNPLRVKNWIVSELESSILLFDTGVSRRSSELIERQIQRMNTDSDSNVESLLAMKDDARAMKAALLRGDIQTFAAVLDRGWQHKKRLADGISNRGIDTIYDVARRAGASAGKVSGAGGGGFMMFVVDPTQRHLLVEALSSQPGRHTFLNFCDHGTQAWRVP